MPDEQQEQIEDVTAVDFAKEAASIVKYKDDWGQIKDSLKSWLKTNVGSKIQGPLDDLDDEIIKSAQKSTHKALDYLKDCKRHVQRLVKNPDGQLTVHNNPPRDNDNLPDKNIAKSIDWWVEPNLNEQNSGENEGT